MDEKKNLKGTSDSYAKGCSFSSFVGKKEKISNKADWRGGTSAATTVRGRAKRKKGFDTRFTKTKRLREKGDIG